MEQKNPAPVFLVMETFLTPSLPFARQVDLTSYITKNIRLTVPMIGSPSDTVTEDKMAIELALAGGIGMIHGNQSIENQVRLGEKNTIRSSKAVGGFRGFGGFRFQRVIRCWVYHLPYQPLPNTAKVKMVQSVKRFVSGFILEPFVMSPTQTLADLDKLKDSKGVSSVAITHDGQLGGRLLGIVTSRDADLCEDRKE